MAVSGKALHDPSVRVLFDALAEGVVWQAADGTVVDANVHAAPILGLTHDELLGRSPRDPRWYAVHEDGRPWPGDEHPGMVALRTGEPQRGRIMGLMVPGRGRRWISIHAMPLPGRGPDGRPPGVVASFVDVTAHIELRRRLEEANRELAELYDHAPCGYHVLDERGRYVRINDTELAWLGCRREEVVGRLGPQAFMTDEGRAAFHEHFPRIQAGERVDGVEFDLVGRHGRTRRVRLSAEPVLGSDGRMVATRSVLHDISELHASRQRLERQTVQQSAVLDNDLVGILRVQRRTVVWKNRAFDTILGYGPDELIGQDTRVLYPDDEAYERLGRMAYPVLQRGGMFRVPLQLRRKDGRLVWTDCSGVLLDAAQDEVIWFSKDITALRRAEELRVQAAELEAENRQLQELGRLQGQFLSHMSHELRTPLNAVIGFAQLLRAGAVPAGSARATQYLEAIESSGRHLLDMIQSMLDTSAADQGRLRFRAEVVDAGELAGEVVAMLAPKAAARHVTVAVEVSPALGALQLDPLRLRQVLLHYLANAIKFSHDGGQVLLRLRPLPDERWRLEVEDHGIGIAAEELPKLFGRFRQLSTGPGRSHDGAGIGLALVKRLVEAQGGSVGVSSVPGAGSVFSAELPVRFGD